MTPDEEAVQQECLRGSQMMEKLELDFENAPPEIRFLIAIQSETVRLVSESTRDRIAEQYELSIAKLKICSRLNAIVTNYLNEVRN